MTLYCRSCGRKLVVGEPTGAVDTPSGMSGVIELKCKCGARQRIVLDNPPTEHLALAQ